MKILSNTQMLSFITYILDGAFVKKPFDPKCVLPLSLCILYQQDMVVLVQYQDTYYPLRPI